MKIPNSLELLKQADLEGIPDPSFLKEDNKGTRDGKMTKYDTAYEKFCQWSALPKRLREPKTIVAFELKWKLPKTSSFQFKERKDYDNKRRAYFWKWMNDVYPDVVDTLYLQATVKGNINAAKFFAELVAKHEEVERPAAIIQPLTIIGVPQERIEKLFVPKKYEDVKGIIPIDE